MRKSLLSTALILIVFGVLIFVAGFGEAMLVIKDEYINLNTAAQSDFEEKALIEGQIDFVYGPYATYEETSKKFGVTVSKKETNYYIVGNYTDEMLFGDSEYDEFYVIFSTADKDMIAQLDDAADKWYNWLTDEDETSLPPEIAIDFKGKLWDEPTDDDYVKYRDEAIEDLEYIDIKKDMYASLKIIDGEVDKSSIIIVVIAAVLALVGVVLLIVEIRAKIRSKNEEFY